MAAGRAQARHSSAVGPGKRLGVVEAPTRDFDYGAVGRYRKATQAVTPWLDVALAPLLAPLVVPPLVVPCAL